MSFGSLGFGGGRGGGGSALSFADLMQRSVAWYDRYFSETTYQEAAASTPADDPSEPIGAWLDRRLQI